jgi:isopentenyl diphosphate isomerase/L-lactate dehydrogenase-like FMN-dependent dehydrogenase
MALSQTDGDFPTLHQTAHKKLDRNMWDYLIGATARETTLLRNRLALERIALRRCVNVA